MSDRSYFLVMPHELSSVRYALDCEAGVTSEIPDRWTAGSISELLSNYKPPVDHTVYQRAAASNYLAHEVRPAEVWGPNVECVRTLLEQLRVLSPSDRATLNGQGRTAAEHSVQVDDELVQARVSAIVASGESLRLGDDAERAVSRALEAMIAASSIKSDTYKLFTKEVRAVLHQLPGDDVYLAAPAREAGRTICER